MSDIPSNLLLRLSSIQTLSELWPIIDEESTRRLKQLAAGSAEEALAEASDIVLYGAGDFCRSVLEAWQGRDLPVRFLVDGNPQKWGTTWQRYLVKSPEALSDTTRDTLCVVAAMDTAEIEALLQHRRIRYVCAERDGTVGTTPAHLLQRLRSTCDLIYETLADDQSRFVFLSILIARVFQLFRFPMRGNVFTDRCTSNPQYFPYDVMSIGNAEAYVDCGVFDGDSLTSFAMEATRLKLRRWRALGIEADPHNTSIARQRLAQQNLGAIEIINAAIGSGQEPVSSLNLHNCRGDRLDSEGYTVALDSLIADFQPTYIKFDIEGAEASALRGSTRTITTYRPKLAVCSYHSTKDLVEIPTYLAQITSEYRLHMRHHRAGSLWETVCYAIPKHY